MNISLTNCLLVVAGTSLLQSCATSPVKISDSSEVPADRRLAGFRALAQPGPTEAKVVIVRDAGFLGGGAVAKVLVDGAPVARLRTGERIEFYLSGGDHIFGVKPDPQLLGALTESSFSFVSGRTYRFRISISESSFRIQPSAQLE